MITILNRLFPEDISKTIYNFVIQDYIRYAFEVNLVSFVYAFIVVTFIAFQLNSHIKKR